METAEREWAFNSERLKITMGICGDAQEGSFMNATLQSTQNAPNLEFSVACHVEIPAHIKTEDALAHYLGGIFGDVIDRHPGLHFEIQLGPADRGEEDD